MDDHPPDDSDWLHRALRHARWRTLDARFAGKSFAASEAVAPAATTTTDANGDDASAADAAAGDDEEAAASAATWESLPDDLLEIVVRYILAIDTRAAIRFCSASATLWRRLWEVRQHACQERMLRWLPEQTVAHVIDAEGRTVTADGESDGDTFYIDDDGRRHSWAAGTSGAPTRSWQPCAKASARLQARRQPRARWLRLRSCGCCLRSWGANGLV